jgi:hypothetical protein
MIASIVILALPNTAQANMSYTPWIHSMIQNGPEMEITVSIFDQTDATNGDGEPIPGLEDEYTLGLGSPEESYNVFENRTFEPGEALEVTEKVCHSWDSPDSITNGENCDDDSTCGYGFCAVAYRYEVTDHCPPFGEDFRYWMTTSSDYDLLYEGEGLGMSNYYEVLEEAGDQCAESESGCSVSLVGNTVQSLSLFQVLLVLI